MQSNKALELDPLHPKRPEKLSRNLRVLATVFMSERMPERALSTVDLSIEQQEHLDSLLLKTEILAQLKVCPKCLEADIN